MTKFHDEIARTLFRGSLPDWQKTPVDEIVKEGLIRSRSIPEIAYVLATAFHETGRFKHREEIGKGAGRDYGEKMLLMRGVPVAYYGRGHVQLTWLQNYAKMSTFLTLEKQREIDLVSNPDLATEPDMAALIIWEGMIRGMFTGDNLSDYITPERTNYVGARRIVNGNDKDDLIAGYAEKFEAALRSGADEPAGSACPLGQGGCPLHTQVAA